jgi:hypothetical protein
MLAGPYTPTHASSCLFRDAMERRGRSRAIPTTAAIRKRHHHQRQLYYSHHPTNPPSPSLSPIRSPQYVSSSFPHFLSDPPLILSHLDRSDDSTSPQSTTLEPATPPELSLDYYDSPPTPPQSLEDQIHEAYALDNIHLAKILYLKLQGIHVVDDSDPRIEQVQEEDFPFGRLILDEDDERTLKEFQRMELHRRRDQRRANKLAQCEKTWDKSIAEYRQQCLSVRRRKQTAAPTHRLDTVGHERQEQHRSLVHLSEPGFRSLLSYKSPDGTPSYLSLECATPINPSSPLDIPGRSNRSSCLRMVPAPVASPSQSIPFRQVHACMNDTLFPNDDAPSDLRSRKRQSHARATLLEVLLQPVTWEKGERSEARIKRRNSLSASSTWSSNGTLCSACSPTSGSPSTVVSTHSSRHFTIVRRLAISTPNPSACASSARMRATHCGAHSLIPIDLQECPLSFRCRSYPQLDVLPFTQQPEPQSRFTTRLVRKLGTSVSTLMDVAAQFQASYLRTAGSIVQFETDSPYGETVSDSWSAKPLTDTAKKTWLRFDPTNPRAKTSEAMSFIEGSGWSETKEEVCPEQEHYTLVQLLSPSERTLPPPSSSMFITPSPLRPRDAPAGLRCRFRPIANPVLLRLKALQNVCAGEGVEWEGRAREGALGFGRDRLQGIAFDGIGRSRLSWEVSF